MLTCETVAQFYSRCSICPWRTTLTKILLSTCLTAAVSHYIGYQIFANISVIIKGSYHYLNKKYMWLQIKTNSGFDIPQTMPSWKQPSKPEYTEYSINTFQSQCNFPSLVSSKDFHPSSSTFLTWVLPKRLPSQTNSENNVYSAPTTLNVADLQIEHP